MKRWIGHHSPIRAGSKNKNAKLTEAAVLEIKRALRDGASRKQLAEDYRVSKTTIDTIATGQTWGHVKL